MAETIEYQYFYTYNTKHREPRITVCYIRREPDDEYPEGRTAVGQAVCSFKDQPCRRIGRAIALQRAQHALHPRHQTTKDQILGGRSVIEVLRASDYTCYPEWPLQRSGWTPGCTYRIKRVQRQTT